MSRREAWTDYVTRTPTETAKPKRAKYNNQPVTTDCAHFPSKREAQVLHELELREKAGEIEKLTRQVEFDLVVNGVLICRYQCDAIYWEHGRRVVIDVKGQRTREYVIKRKLMLACHGIEVVER